MEVKAKKCKGTGRAIGSGCGNPTKWRKYGLCMDCYKIWLYSTPEGDKVLNSGLKRAKKHVENENKKIKREFKEKNKSITKLKQEARSVFQQWIRMRDANLKCISCGNDSEIWDAGHFKKAELYSGLIFDERNVWKQCRKCNTYLDGNEGEYRKRLIEMFGQEWMDVLDDDAIKLRSYKWTREELIETKEKYKKLLKELNVGENI